MKTFASAFLLACLGLHAGLADVVLRDEVHDKPGAPPSIANLKVVYRVNIAGVHLKSFSAPNFDDPPETAYHSVAIDDVVYLKGKKLTLPKPLGKMLHKLDSPSTSDVVLLSPYYLIAEGSDGHPWLITVRRQDDRVSICPLLSVVDVAPFDQVFWADFSEGSYTSDSSELRQLFIHEEEKGRNATWKKLETTTHPNVALKNASSKEVVSYLKTVARDIGVTLDFPEKIPGLHISYSAKNISTSDLFRSLGAKLGFEMYVGEDSVSFFHNYPGEHNAGAGAK